MAKCLFASACAQNSLSALTQTRISAGSAQTEHIELTVSPARCFPSLVATIDTPLAAWDSADVNAEAVIDFTSAQGLSRHSGFFWIVTCRGTCVYLTWAADAEFCIFMHFHPVRDPANGA